LFRPPNHLVKEWPEIFEDMYMNTMPVAYVKSLRLEFQSGRVWEINVVEQLEDLSSDVLTDRIIETFNEYRNEITRVDFSIDVDKLKEDIINQTKDLL
jgi:hypothetical protein